MKSTINPKAVNKVLEGLAIEIIKRHPNANYSADSTNGDMALAVDMAIEHYGLNLDHRNDLKIFRENFEKAIAKKYGVKFTYEPGEDLEVKYQKRRVPKLTQVKSGILDLMIGNVSVVSRKDTMINGTKITTTTYAA
jgi:hypothetical protein